MSQELRLTIEIVPKPLRGVSLYKTLRRSAWKKLREQVMVQHNHRCGICQVGNVTLYCHENWQYDDIAHIQKLNGFMMLCERCNHQKIIGRAGLGANEGKLDFKIMVEHFMRVNQCSYEEYEAHRKEAFKSWRERNKHAWTTDFGAYAYLVPPLAEVNNSV